MSGKSGRRPALDWLEQENPGVVLQKGQTLEDLRFGIGCQQKEIARDTGLSVRTVRNIEKNEAVAWKSAKRYFQHLAQITQLRASRPKWDSGLVTTQETCDLPWLKFEVSEWDESCGPAAILRPEHEVVPFHGTQRKKDLEVLRTWCLNGPTFSARLHYAEGGNGKTRLALELCRKLRETHGWAAGFLDPEGFMKMLDPWVFDKSPQPPLLVIVDYAGDSEKTEVLARLLTTGKSARNGAVLRVLMLDRGCDWTSRLEQRLGTRDRLAVDMDGKRSWAFELSSASAAKEERLLSFNTAAEAFRIALGQSAAPVPTDLATEAVYSNLLFVHTQALLTTGGKAAAARRPAILGALLNRERQFWRRRLVALGAPAIWFRDVEEIAAIVNLRRHVPDISTLRGWIQDAGIASDKPAQLIEVAAELLKECYPCGETGIGALQPDLIREYFADHSLGRFPKLRPWLMNL